MGTYLVITRGDAVAPVPIAICDDPEIVGLAIRAAWRRTQELAQTLVADSLDASVAAGTIRHLEDAARDADGGGA